MAFFSRVLALLVTLVLMVGGAPLDRMANTLALNESQALGYLQQFGYLPTDSTGIRSLLDTKSAITAFQRTAGLKPSGSLTQETLKQMVRPRCGLPDVRGSANRFKLSDSKWPKKQITYFISKYPASHLNRQQVDQEIARALQVWSDHTDLTFRVIDHRRDDRPDIDIRFEDREHGDGSSFDGSGGILGHAFSPASGGDTHLDDSEEWTINASNGINLFLVAAHEFGHSLGLDHSQVRSALMAPFYKEYQPTFRLDTDDIQGIQHLYGKKTNQGARALPRNPPPRSPPPPATPATPTYGVHNPSPDPTVDNSLCKDLTFDTIFTDLQGVTYVIKGFLYWTLGKVDVSQNVQRKWPGLPPKIDAAFSHRDLGKTYFFSGAHFWRYQGDRLDQGYPKLISQSFPRIPDNLDAAFVSPRNNQIYFFKGSNYWKFDYTTLPAVAYEYPVPIGAWWQRVPDALDAALTREGITYFVKRGKYARILVNSHTIDSPESVGVLFGCPKMVGGKVDPAWKAATDRRSSQHIELIRRPTHQTCMKHPGCRQFP